MQRYNHARGLFQQGQHEEALREIQQLLWEHPGHPELLLSKALCLEALHRPKEALEVAREGLAVKEDARLRQLVTRLEQVQREAKSSTPIDAVALIRQIEDQERESPLALLTSRRAYVVIFLLMFLLLACVGPMLWWAAFGRPVE